MNRDSADNEIGHTAFCSYLTGLVSVGVKELGQKPDRWKDNRPNVNKRKEGRKFSWEFGERGLPSTAPRPDQEMGRSSLSSKP
ncbi:unnamed protein product [Larinioides sclopetarius]|uniref:Uncharacterized protein n=1 Tax=Larinioides sclopetarius TaxID=280406 RepID=A0AAV2A0V2_9ARAC